MNALNRYAKKRFRRINILLNSFPESNDLEILHRVRLEIKKIKTLLRLIHYNDKRFKDHESYLPFRSIFRACEKIREPQVVHELLVKFTGDKTHLVYSPDLLNQFSNEVPIHLKKVKRQERIIRKEIKKVNSTTYNRYLRKKNQELKSVLTPAFRVYELHALRKLIKEIYHLYSIKIKKKSIDPFFSQSAVLIGNWHDKVIVIQKIRKSGLQTDLIKKLQQEKRVDIANLKRLIRDFCN
jgi:hypothetical protein